MTECVSGLRTQRNGRSVPNRVRAEALDAPVKVVDHARPIGLGDADLDALPVGFGSGITEEHGRGIHGSGGLNVHLGLVAGFHSGGRLGVHARVAFDFHSGAQCLMRD